jgi:hypothetical protein
LKTLAFVFAFSFSISFVGCEREDAFESTCARDGDCPAGWMCVVGTGVCVTQRVPDAAVADSALPDARLGD